MTIPGATIDGKTLDEYLAEHLEPSMSRWNPLPLLFVHSRTKRLVDSYSALFIPALQAAREAERRLECASNMQRLTLALLLYEKDHGNMPEGDWREAIRPYLGDNADRYFQCPTHGLAEGETNYAMIGGVSNESPTPNQILLVEVFQPQKLGEGDGRIPLEKAKLWRKHVMFPPNIPRPDDWDGLGSFHTGGVNATHRNGAARFISESINPEFLQSLLDGTATTLP
jgi:hypothetical protein